MIAEDMVDDGGEHLVVAEDDIVTGYLIAGNAVMVVLFALGDIVAEDGYDDGVEDEESDEVSEDAEKQFPSGGTGHAYVGECVGVDEHVERHQEGRVLDVGI